MTVIPEVLRKEGSGRVGGDRSVLLQCLYIRRRLEEVDHNPRTIGILRLLPIFIPGMKRSGNKIIRGDG